MVLHQRLVEHAKTRPDHPAVEQGGRVLSYRDLLDRVNRMAWALQKVDVGPGVRVAVSLPNNALHLVVLCGLFSVGAVVVSLSPDLNEGERDQSLVGLDVAVMVTTDTKVSVGERRQIPVRVLMELSKQAPRTGQLPTLTADSPMLCRQSSGTTGVPKTTIWSHAQVEHWFDRQIRYVGWQSSDRYLVVINMSFAFGRELCLGMLHVGATTVIHRSAMVAVFTQAVRARGITLLYMPPTFIRTLLQFPPDQVPLFPDLRALFTSSAPMSAAERRRVWRQITPQFFESYGSNEIGAVTMSSPLDIERHPDSVGRVIAEVETQIVDDEGRVLPAGMVGQVRCRSPLVPSGYEQDPAATARHYRDGWFYPGDLACLDHEGYLYLKGRVDDVINNEGAKVYPLEIEQVLLSHSQVKEAAVFGWPHERYGSCPVAYVVARDGVTADELEGYCLSRMARYKTPGHICFVAEMPKNAAGKILKTRLKELLEQDETFRR